MNQRITRCALCACRVRSGAAARWQRFVGMNELLKGIGSANQKPMPIKLHKDFIIAAM